MPAAGAAVAEVAEGAGHLEGLVEPPEPRERGPTGRAGLMKPLVVLALPGMYLFYKYSQYRREQRELSRRRVTERELQHLHHKICVICVNARATMQTAPCGHRVVCRRCFVKTIQMAVSQRLLPLRCVICRAKILRLKQTLIPRDYSMSGKSWVLPQSASAYSMGTGVAVGVSGHGRWGTGNVPASASLYSMASGSSSISGVSSVSSSTNSSGSSTLGKPTRVRQPTGATLRRSQTQSMKLRIQEYQDPIQQVAEEDDAMRENRERRLPPIKEFQRDYRAGKASTRIRCAQKIVTQLETSPSRRGTSSTMPRESTSSSSSSTRTSIKRSSSAVTPKTTMTVAQEVQKTKKEKEREKEREKAEKARQKEEEKAEKARQKEAKKLAKEEKKRAKKEAKARRKEAEEALLRDEK
ncbi:chromatin assembly factor 1 subunit A-B isoform X2 [Cephus cinctus]|uniref:Chromatin assembly factor 1 subunit A-B isoform X2 n=1 Tax=Cephus cinctus TaxID=211228 RepID=A0AAJ7VZI9_CEPCN|nr:chromatin assembly factor 1 subunit A-B isoform X2 [Cephus cinctus]